MSATGMGPTAAIAKGIASRALENLKTQGHELGEALEERALDAAAGLAMTQLVALAGGDTTEARKIAQARFDNLAAAGAQGVANALVGAVRSTIVEGLGTLISLSA